MGRTKTEAKRRAILAAAARVFARYGYHGATVAQVADEVGMGLGTFYRYFRNKLDVFHAVIDEVIERVSAIVLADVAGAADTVEAYRAQVQRIGEALFSAFQKNRDLARLLFVEAPGIDEALNRKLDEATARLAAMTGAYLAHGRERGFLRADLDVETTAYAINAIIFEGVRHAARADEPARHKQRWSDAAVRLMFDGIAEPAPPFTPAVRKTGARRA